MNVDKLTSQKSDIKKIIKSLGVLKHSIEALGDKATLAMMGELKDTINKISFYKEELCKIESK